jgi:hypothetical protein
VCHLDQELRQYALLNLPLAAWVVCEACIACGTACTALSTVLRQCSRTVSWQRQRCSILDMLYVALMRFADQRMQTVDAY